MQHILTIQEAVTKSNLLRRENKTIVVTGGCFDIVHIGHIALLKESKEQGDSLFVFLESDRKITELKGAQRPIHPQQQRAEVLASIRFVDYVVLLPYLTNDADYATLVAQIQPDIIAVTEHDRYIEQKEKQAEKIGAKVIAVTKNIPAVSTSRLAKMLETEE